MPCTCISADPRSSAPPCLLSLRLQIELEEGADIPALERQLQGCADIPSLLRFLLAAEAVYCDAGEGLPRGE